jgi:glycosyltransferase involved in cell wall biosynthesis
MVMQGGSSWQPDEWQPGWAFNEDCLEGRDIEITLAGQVLGSSGRLRPDGNSHLQENVIAEQPSTYTPVEADKGESQQEGGGRQACVEMASAKWSGWGESEGACDVSIVICTKDRAQLLDRMLESLDRAATEVACEVIVVEGGSSDDTVDVLRRHEVTQVYSESECLGQGRHSWPQLYNFGFSKARGRWAMYASDDITFSEGAVDRAVKFLDEQKENVAGGIFFYRNSQVTDPLWGDYGVDITHGSKLLMNYGLVRLNHFREAGGLDESYQFYCADTDLCYKLYERSVQLIPLPGCFVDHDNVMDMQKSRNMAGADRDIELLLRRWQHFVSPDLPKPRRLIWSDEIKDAFSVPAELDVLDSSIEEYWLGLACLQQNLLHEAREHFLHATDRDSSHWRVWLYLAKAICRCQKAENRMKCEVASW